MSGVVCYIERAERGMLPVRVRLVSARLEESWNFPEIPSDDRLALQRGLRDGAAWLAERLRTHGRARLAALVLDADGSLCSWVSTPSADPDAIGAMLRHAGAPAGEEDASHAMGSPPQLSLSPDAQTPGAASVQPLGAGDSREAPSGLVRRRSQTGPQPRQRMGVLVVPDATVRLLLDELDAHGVAVGRTVSVWHAIAEAFGGPGSASRAERVVAEPSATSAQLVLDPASGRTLWVWSRSGVPVAAGAFRVILTGSGAQARPSLERADLARLASEWIAWSTQLGASPSRVHVLLPAEAWTDSASLGESVAAVWPGATADIAFDDDPLGAALSRFADGLGEGAPADAGSPALVSLQSRPGRQHRSMYRWAAASIALAAGVMGVAAYVLNESAKTAVEEAAAARTGWREVAGGILPSVNEDYMAEPNFDGEAVAELGAELDRRRREIAPVQATPEKPVLSELEALSFVLGNADYRLTRLDISGSSVYIDVTVPDTAAYEELMESLSRIAGSSIRRWEPSVNPAPQGQIRVQLTGFWRESARSTPPGGVS